MNDMIQNDLLISHVLVHTIHHSELGLIVSA